jgi:hypothetical protein
LQSRFNGPEWYSGVCRDLALTHLLVIRELDRLPLRLGQDAHRTLQVRVYFELREVFMDMCPAVAVAVRLLSEALLQTAIGLFSPQSINRTSTGESGDPGKRLAHQWIVVCCPIPYLQKDILKHVFRVSVTVERFNDQAS